MGNFKITYSGDLRCKATHLLSGTNLTTDAPPDNNGKGEAFSPTDLLATALVSCMITIMGIRAEKNGWQLGEIEGDYEKLMESNPRRVSEVKILLKFKNHNLDEKEQRMLERVAHLCPVAQSLSKDLIINLKLNF